MPVTERWNADAEGKGGKGGGGATKAGTCAWLSRQLTHDAAQRLTQYSMKYNTGLNTSSVGVIVVTWDKKNTGTM